MGMDAPALETAAEGVIANHPVIPDRCGSFFIVDRVPETGRFNTSGKTICRGFHRWHII